MAERSPADLRLLGRAANAHLFQSASMRSTWKLAERSSGGSSMRDAPRRYSGAGLTPQGSGPRRSTMKPSALVTLRRKLLGSRPTPQTAS